MSKGNADRRVVLWLAGGVLLLIVLTAVFAPVTRDDDVTPSTYNSGTHGAKAAYLILESLGYGVSRSDQPLAAILDGVDAPHTTLVLAGPNAPTETSQKREYASVERFLESGGRVFSTGFFGAYFLPGGRTGEASAFIEGLCHTTSEGHSAYAEAGSIDLYDRAPWNSLEPAVRVDQRCGNDAAVVHRTFPNGGEMVWWSNSEPLSTRGIAQDSSLRLLLASVGPASGEHARHVIFDEFYHGEQVAPSDYLRGLPLRSLALQATLLIVLLVFSFSRRSGPIREPLYVPRTSPVEFAENMGALYERAGATEPATEAARRRLLHFLEAACGLPDEVLRSDAATIATVVHSRFGVEAKPLQDAIERVESARYTRLRPREALLVVRAVDREIVRLRAAIDRPQVDFEDKQHTATEMTI
jgi:hypothetical protein